MLPIRADSAIKEDVEVELQWDPAVQDDRQLAVTVVNGVVTLSGFATRYMDYVNAEKAAKRVAGVKGIANDIHVNLPDERTDPDIVGEAVAALRRELGDNAEGLRVIVKSGWVAIEGECEWNYQKELAGKALRTIPGIKGINNFIALKPTLDPSDLQVKIKDALVRNVTLDADNISVDVLDGNVILRGSVKALIEKQEAQRTAWMAPGVTAVQNDISVSV